MLRSAQALATVTREQLVDERKRLFGDAETPVAVCVIRLLASRRFDLVIDAVAQLAKQGRRVNLLLVGEGPAKQALAEQAMKLGVNLHFYGPCYDENVLARLTAMANVTVCPGPVGLTAIQSMAFGTPVISNDDYDTQMPEFETIITGKTGDLFRAGDVASLAETLERWTRTTWTDDSTRLACQRIIDEVWNAKVQRCVIDRAVDGKPADDLWRSREGCP
ncbi:MAG: glycosyltransferase [Tepidisphaeraceae bacterium]